MKFVIFLALELLIPFHLMSQVSIDSLVKEGIQFHDSGEYQKAIESYEKAYSIDSSLAMLNYEIAYSYFALKDYPNTIKFSDKLLNIENDYMAVSYTHLTLPTKA